MYSIPLLYKDNQSKTKAILEIREKHTNKNRVKQDVKREINIYWIKIKYIKNQRKEKRKEKESIRKERGKGKLKDGLKYNLLAKTELSTKRVPQIVKLEIH